MKKIILSLLILWLGFIFYLSGNTGIESHKQSNKITSIIMEIDVIKSALKDLKVSNTDYLIRKNAHALEYIVLAVIVSCIFSILKNKGNARLIYILFICLLTAVLDEFHQAFVPGRTSQVSDIVIDFIGALIGVFLFRIVYALIYMTKKIA